MPEQYFRSTCKRPLFRPLNESKSSFLVVLSPKPLGEWDGCKIRRVEREEGLKRSVLLSTVSFPALNLSRQIHVQHAPPFFQLVSRDRKISLMNKLSDLSPPAKPCCLPRCWHATLLPSASRRLEVFDNQSQFHRGVFVTWLLPPILVFLFPVFSHFLLLSVRCLYTSRLIRDQLEITSSSWSLWPENVVQGFSSDVYRHAGGNFLFYDFL